MRRSRAQAARHRGWCEQVQYLLRANHGVIRVSEHALTRRAVAVAVEAGIAARHRPGVVAAPDASPERVAAVVLRGVVSHLSAAKLHGWNLAREPEQVQLSVPRGRRVNRGTRALRPKVAGRRVRVHYARLTPSERTAGITGPVRTVLDCAASLPFEEALAVADSALRAGDVSPRSLMDAAERLTGPGSARARRVAAHATGLAANPYESALRAICLRVPGLRVTPQHQIRTPRLTARVDLADTDLKLVLEADSFAFHANPTAFAKDIRRYTELVLGQWTVLRFSWRDVFTDPTWVEQILREAVDSARKRLRPGRRAARRRDGVTGLAGGGTPPQGAQRR